MLLEARRSAANERTLRARGAVEPADDVYRAMQLAYPACFLAVVLEAWVEGSGFGAVARRRRAALRGGEGAEVLGHRDARRALDVSRARPARFDAERAAAPIA